MPNVNKCKISNFLGKSVFFHNVGTGHVTLTNIVQWITAKNRDHGHHFEDYGHSVF